MNVQVNQPVDNGEPWLSVDELQTWHALSRLVATLPTALGRQLQGDSELSYVEYYALARLSEEPDRTVRMSQLAILVNAELSRLSHLVRRLEKRGLVRRETDVADGRFTNAILTDRGYEVLVAAAPGHVRHVRSLVFDALDADEQQALRGAVAKIITQLNEGA
jgi:DNA-binding MarR family transcriptional regulator